MGSPSTPAVAAPSIPSARSAAALTLADVQGFPQVTINGWTLTRLSMSSVQDMFSVHIQATHKIGSAVLTFDIHGTLGDFTSNGTLHVHDQHLARSDMGASGLAGQLVADWSLSAPVAHPIASMFALDVALPLFRWPLLIGDFPMFLFVEARLHLAPVFGQSAQVLQWHAAIGFSGSQRLTFDEQSVVGSGLNHWNHGQPAISGHQFPLPSLDLAATFPYLDIGDDIDHPLAGALVWTGFTLDTLTGSGTNPLCLRTDALVHADAGVTAWLFGLRFGLSQQLYAHHIGSVSLPPSPPCALA
jgi:hypothetical protein